jgi:multidrug efflux pump subunit AcrA (membrane-fusion protein)
VRINPVIDPATRSFEVEIQIANSDSSLKPGGFAKAAIVVDENASAAIVPLEAIVSFAGVTKIFRIQNDVAHEVQVKVGLQGTEWVEITDPPLAVGTEIVTSDHTNLADKTPIVRRLVAQPSSSEVAR